MCGTTTIPEISNELFKKLFVDLLPQPNASGVSESRDEPTTKHTEAPSNRRLLLVVHSLGYWVFKYLFTQYDVSMSFCSVLLDTPADRENLDKYMIALQSMFLQGIRSYSKLKSSNISLLAQTLERIDKDFVSFRTEGISWEPRKGHCLPDHDVWIRDMQNFPTSSPKTKVRPRLPGNLPKATEYKKGTKVLLTRN